MPESVAKRSLRSAAEAGLCFELDICATARAARNDTTENATIRAATLKPRPTCQSGTPCCQERTDALHQPSARIANAAPVTSWNTCFEARTSLRKNPVPARAAAAMASGIGEF